MSLALPAAPSYAGPWASLPPSAGLPAWLVQELESNGKTQMTPVQASVLPLLNQHASAKDVLVEAVTGSGKTLAFVLPILSFYHAKYQAGLLPSRPSFSEEGPQDDKVEEEDEPKKRSCKAVEFLILAPTRELAQQIQSVLDHLTQYAPFVLPPSFLAIGSSQPSNPSSSSHSHFEASTSQPATKEKYPSGETRIVIGTPGTIRAWFAPRPGTSSTASNELHMPALHTLVLDEADRLLDQNFAPDMRLIWAHLPRQRRVALFSATMMDLQSAALKPVRLRNPVRVLVKVASVQTGHQRRTPAGLQNHFLLSTDRDKLSCLVKTLLFYCHRQQAHAKVVVYFDTCASVDFFYRLLKRFFQTTTAALQPALNIDTRTVLTLHSLHGHLPSKARSAALNAFSLPTEPGHLAVLLATDVAARGLDLPDIDCVIQFDPPSDPKVFAHRAGRTARAGRLGVAVTLLRQGSEEAYPEFMAQRHMPMTELHLPSQPEAVTGTTNPLDPVPLAQAFQRIILQDRDLHDRSIRALTSHARAYSNHEASFIFRSSEMNLVHMAESWGMLKLPRMPELRTNTDVFQPGLAADLVWHDYGYKDASREKARIKKRDAQRERHPDKERNAPDENTQSGQSEEEDLFPIAISTSEKRQRRTELKPEAWSKQKDRHQIKAERREVKDRKAAFKENQKNQANTRLSDSEEEERRQGKEWMEDVRARKKQRQIAKSQTADLHVTTFDDL